jgi:uncharacterized spore protein YtfJ
MKVTDVLGTASEAITVKRVFAEPYETEGITVIAAAAVAGGAGGGSGTDPGGQQGEGAGFGASARPVGAYLIKDGQVHWRPAIDPNRIITVVGLVAIAYLLRRPRRRGPALARKSLLLGHDAADVHPAIPG